MSGKIEIIEALAKEALENAVVRKSVENGLSLGEKLLESAIPNSAKGTVHKIEKVAQDYLANFEGKKPLIITKDGGEYTSHEYYAMNLGYDSSVPKHVIDSEIFADEQQWNSADGWNAKEHKELLNENRKLLEQDHEEALKEHKIFLKEQLAMEFANVQRSLVESAHFHANLMAQAMEESHSSILTNPFSSDSAQFTSRKLTDTSKVVPKSTGFSNMTRDYSTEKYVFKYDGDLLID